MDKVSFNSVEEHLAQENRHFVVASQQEKVINNLFDNVNLWKSSPSVLAVRLV